MRRSYLWLAGGVALAGIAIAGHHGGSESPPAAAVASVPLAQETAAFEALADHPSPVRATAAATTPVATTPASAPAAAIAALTDEVDLDHLVRNGDHYEAPLRDGRHAVLTLDPELQGLAEKLLDEARAPRGAIVAMAPDGRVLALAGRRSEDVKGGAKAKDGTFDWHLATDVWAPAASVFKLVTASALIAAGVAPSDKVCFHGGLRSVNESNLRDDKRDSNCQSLEFGVAHSQNAILGKLAFQHLDPSLLSRTAHDLGLAGPLPGGELAGTIAQLAIPDAHDVTFAQTAAGFSSHANDPATTTPWGSHLSAVGGALLAATFADDGEQPAPRLIDAIVDGDGPHAPTTIAPHRALPVEVAHAVSKMMVGTCEYGSASHSFGKHRHGQGVTAAGKTGTLTSTDPFYMEYSWFVGYAPVDKPQIIVSVLLGNPENWHLKGHSAARRLIDLAINRASDRGTKVASRQDAREQW